MNIETDGTPQRVESDNVTSSGLGDRTFDSPEAAIGALADDPDDRTEQPDQANDEQPVEAEAEATDENLDAHDDEAEGDEPVDEAGAEDGQEDVTEEDLDQSQGQDQTFAEDGVEVVLATGETVPIKELKDGYLRQQDYTSKATELSEGRNELNNQFQHVAMRADLLQRQVDALTGHLEKIVPAKPDVSLLAQNPNAYHEQLALREAVMAELGEVLQFRQNVTTANMQMSQEDTQRALHFAEQELTKALPGLKDPGALQRFRKANEETARSFGFTQDEINAGYQLHEPRTAQILYWARLGKQADHNRRNAKRRLAKGPQKAKAAPVAPNKARSAKAQSAAKQRKAMSDLSKSGSIQDAMRIDFD